MKICRVKWLLDARGTTSYRRMYGLVILLIASPCASTAERATAEFLKERFEEVIELAIAPAAALKDIRCRFGLLVDVVGADALKGTAEREAQFETAAFRKLGAK